VSARLAYLLARLEQARTDIGGVLIADYPAGAPIRWRCGRPPVQRGTVIHHGSRLRLYVRNDHSGKCRWINAEWIEA
jgi:hypothetical protein